MQRGWSDEQMAARVAADLWDGAYVNLGIGLPTLVADLIAPDREVVIHSENGILGMGPTPPPELADEDLVSAGKAGVSLLPGGSLFDSATSFAMLRGGHIDVGVLGGYQVAANGDLANWKLPGEPVPGVGGAADISLGVKQVWVLMKHVTRMGEPRIVKRCTYPLTGPGVVKRIYTDMAVIHLTPDSLYLVEVAPGYTRADVVAATEAPLR